MKKMILIFIIQLTIISVCIPSQPETNIKNDEYIYYEADVKNASYSDKVIDIKLTPMIIDNKYKFFYCYYK